MLFVYAGDWSAGRTGLLMYAAHWPSRRTGLPVWLIDWLLRARAVMVTSSLNKHKLIYFSTFFLSSTKYNNIFLKFSYLGRYTFKIKVRYTVSIEIKDCEDSSIDS